MCVCVWLKIMEEEREKQAVAHQEALTEFRETFSKELQDSGTCLSVCLLVCLYLDLSVCPYVLYL